jgi:SAM-dependent MidA family methyltransferase
MTALETIIRDEIARSGPLPFARFMELALYHPEHGYYEREVDPVGRRGDFYTSVSVGPLFGELLAWRFAGWLDGTGLAGLQLIEAGAHDGRLAADLLGWLRVNRPALLERLRYTIIEPSAQRQQRQRERLADFRGLVNWQAGLAQTHGAAVIFANELLDAFPVQRVGWDARARAWFEWGVTGAAGGFSWARLPMTVQLTAELRRWLAAGTDWGEAEIAALEPALPDGFTCELCPAAEAWWSRAAESLQRGWLVTFDYGFMAGEQVRAGRAQGTLRAYRAHRVSDDLLATPGEQDLTAHVNFAVLQAAGERAGLRTVEGCTQERFLARAAATWPGEWSSERTRQLRTLVHPGHMGQAFRVLVQERGENVFAGLQPD